jgi:L-lactate dehydrogenase
MKISIIGSGNVGSTLAYALVLQGLAQDLVLVDRSVERARGDALDLTHALSFQESFGRVRSGSVEDSAGSGLIVLTLSVPFRPPMKNRADLAAGNRPVFADLVPRLAALSPQAIVLVVSNPVDTMTWWALQDSGFPENRVFGVGTLVDSARFRMELSQHYGIHPNDLRAYVLGEHGPSQFAAMSVASAGGELIEDRALARELLERQEASAHAIVADKGYTNFAIASATAMVVDTIVHDRKRTIPVSVKLNDYFGVSGVCLSVPCVIGAGGVERILKPNLDPGEQTLFRRCAETVTAQMHP